MFILAVILGILAVGLIVFGLTVNRVKRRAPGYAMGLVAIALFVASAVVVVPAGHVGVVVLFGSVADDQLDEGIGFVNPLATVEHVSVRTQSITMSGSRAIKSLSRDGLLLTLEITIQSHINGADAPWLYRNFGVGRGRATANVLVPASRAAIREVIAKYTANEAYSVKRDEVPERIRERLNRKIRTLLSKRGGDKRLGIVVDGIELRDIKLPPRVTAAIERKLEEEQRAQRMRFVLDRERQEATRKEIEASGIAKFQEIVTKGIDDRLLRWKGIDATLKLAQSPNAKIVVIGGGKDGLPLILNTTAAK